MENIYISANFEKIFINGNFSFFTLDIFLPNLSPDRIRPIPLIDLESISVIFSDECTPDCQPIVNEFEFPTVFKKYVTEKSHRHHIGMRSTTMTALKLEFF